MSVKQNPNPNRPEWNILPMTLPITYGRHKRNIAKAFQTIYDRHSDRDCMYIKSKEEFRGLQEKIATSYNTIKIDSNSNIIN